MSGLAALLAGRTKPDLYLWHNAAHVEDVAHAVEHAGWRFAYLDGWTIEDQQTFLKSVGVALDFPDHYGESFAAMADCLGGLDGGERGGVVVLWDGWSPLARADEDAFSSALAAFGDRARAADGPPVAVLLRGEGPTIDVPELPDGPH